MSEDKGFQTEPTVDKTLWKAGFAWAVKAKYLECGGDEDETWLAMFRLDGEGKLRMYIGFSIN